jgi:hypothetical protein
MHNREQWPSVSERGRVASEGKAHTRVCRSQGDSGPLRGTTRVPWTHLPLLIGTLGVWKRPILRMPWRVVRVTRPKMLWAMPNLLRILPLKHLSAPYHPSGLRVIAGTIANVFSCPCQQGARRGVRPGLAWVRGCVALHLDLPPTASLRARALGWVLWTWPALGTSAGGSSSL